MSKSLGNVIDPLDVLERHGIDPLRYYFLRHIDTFTDSAGKQRSQTLKSIKKVSGRVYALNVKITGEEQGDDGPPPFSDPNDFPLGGQHSA